MLPKWSQKTAIVVWAALGRPKVSAEALDMLNGVEV